MNLTTCIEELDRLGVPATAGRPAARAALKAAGIVCATDTLAAALRERSVVNPQVRGHAVSGGHLVEATRQSLDRIAEAGGEDHCTWDALSVVAVGLAAAFEMASLRDWRDLAAISKELRATLHELDAMAVVRPEVGESDPIDDLRESWSRPVLAIMGNEASA